MASQPPLVSVTDSDTACRPALWMCPGAGALLAWDRGQRSAFKQGAVPKNLCPKWVPSLNHRFSRVIHAIPHNSQQERPYI